MTAFNKVIIAGNISRDIELRHIPSGTAVADVSLAINSSYKDKNDQKKEEVTFVDCTLWGKTAELASEYLKKGSAVLFEGKLHQESWTDKDSGQKRSKLKVVVENMQFLGSAPGKSGSGGGQQKQGGGSQRSQGGNGRNYDEFDQTNDRRGGYGRR